jgi:hypothetical protein
MRNFRSLKREITNSMLWNIPTVVGEWLRGGTTNMDSRSDDHKNVPVELCQCVAVLLVGDSCI